MEAPPKLQFFEVAVLIPKIKSLVPRASKMGSMNPSTFVLRSALRNKFLEHRRYLAWIDEFNEKSLDEVLSIIVEEEWIHEIKQALHHDEDTSH